VSSSAGSQRVHSALILAAGNGDRFKQPTPESKLLQPVLGTPLLLRTLDSATRAGITTAELIVGFRADSIARFVETHPVPGLDVHLTYNPRWHLENGVSASVARPRLEHTRFALLMGDHLFDPDVLRRMLARRVRHGDSLLAVDASPHDPAVAAEATRVRLRGSRIVEIGKLLPRYDALDTGLFVCDPSLFPALEAAQAEGDTTLSGGIRRLAREGRMRAFDVSGAAWHDIDTVADLESAEQQLAQPEPGLPVVA
jgi:choline kinase